jgi:3'-phosphoadenosine 5'-phosphosulfate sulfotransferase (PAPS reductase)/FAD synthetase
MNIIWSYGGGTQSAAIAALIVQGELPKPDIAVIADTGREAATTWDYLTEVIQPALDFDIHIIPHSFEGRGYNTVDLYAGKDKDTLLIPAYTSAANGHREGMLRKYCSHEWKTRPLRRFCRDQGIDGGDMWIGFSTDEMERCRVYDSGEKWRHIYPLIDQRMNRGDCIAMVERMGWPTPPRSACWMCPYRSDQEWLHLKETAFVDFLSASRLEKEIQARDSKMFLHKSCRPIDEVRLNSQPDLFAKPCASGMCFT